MQIAVGNPLARIGLQFIAYGCLALIASNLVVEANFASRLNVAWIVVGAVMITLAVKQGAAARIVIATFLTTAGFVILSLTAGGELYWANWGQTF